MRPHEADGSGGCEKGLSPYALELSPIQRPVPVKTTEPIPADIRPGSTAAASARPARWLR